MNAASVLTILVVEDNAGDFLLIQQMLFEIKDFSKTIVHADNLQLAIEATKANHVDVILLDLSLTDSYGIDSFLKLSEIVPQTPILILSGLNDKTFAKDAVKNGAQDYLVKGEFEEKLLSKSILYSIERKAGVELLRQSQETYKLLFDNNPIPMYIIEKNSYRIIKVNQSSSKYFGYSTEEFLNMTIFDLHPKEEHQYLKELIANNEYSEPHIFKHIKKNGKVIYVECRVKEIVLDDIDCFLVLADDLTEKRQVQEEVLFQANILKNVKDTIFVTDVSGKITYWNDGAEQTFGYKSSETLGKHFDILYPEIDKPKLSRELKDIVNGKISNWKSRLITKDDKIIWSENTTSLLNNDKGEAIGFIRVAKDVSQSVRFAEQQKESVAMLNSIFNNVVQSIVLVDTQFRVKAFNVFANKQCIQLMGLELQENRSFLDYLTPEVKEQFLNEFEKALVNETVQWELGLRFSNTSIFWFATSLSPVADDAGNVLGVCISMVDVSARKLADEKFQGQFLEIENTNKELDRLIKILSHDLKAPMNSVNGLISLAREEKNPEEFHTYLSMMEKSLKKLELFTNDVISSLKNRSTLKFEPYSLNNLVSELIEELKFGGGADQIVISNDIKKEIEIDIDPTKIRIILSNLISNAVRHHDEFKTDKFIRVSAAKHPFLLEISVEDNGKGIAQENHQRIFDPYFTIGNHSDSNGLGLSNVKDTVQKLRGTIDLESTLGIGSVFRIDIPMG
jgi:PAS domain S-box-containing protein